MKKSLFILFAVLTGFFSAKADLTADWKMHMPFDAWPVQVVETPSRVYFLSSTYEPQPSLPERSASSNSLFYYDKEGDEIISVNERATANGNAVACIGYNASKKYLLVVYKDCNIDFIYDDGRLYNLQALKATSIQGRKEANSVTFDNKNSRAYVATSFGYVALNDDKHEIAESRNYGKDIQSIGRSGDKVVLCSDNAMYFAPASAQRFNFADYVKIEGVPAATSLIPLDDGKFVAHRSSGYSPVLLLTPSGSGYDWKMVAEDNEVYRAQQTPSGYVLSASERLLNITPSGELNVVGRPQDDTYRPATSLDGNQLWTLTSRKGLRNYRKNGNSWTLTKDYMRPNAPAAYIVSDIAYNSKYGILAGSNGADLAYSDFNQLTPSNISALKGGFWKEYSPIYTSTLNIPLDYNFYGVAIDPQNPKYVYRGNTVGGLMRINLEQPDDVMVFANPSNMNRTLPGFVKVADDLAAWNILCRFTTPRFTGDGTMWTLYNNADKLQAELWYWNASDRAATTSPSTYRPMKKLLLPEKFESSNMDVMTTLTRNKNIVVVGGSDNGGQVLVYDHKGTPEATNDDRYVYLRTPYDQDGGTISFLAINNCVEDPETGLVWILSQRGVFTFNPATIFDNPNTINRIKVSRNDGTGLADYLLNEINVNNMSIDGEGRKWFSTSNGLVCTSRDGRQILAEFTTDNSYLPSNNVFATCYNPDNNSILVATDGGLVEMFPSGSGGGDADTSGMRAYPNPVEPDYYGWVRIDNIADGSLVKITDAKGGVVKELGPVQGGSVEWDVSGLNNTRVTTGVYYIMVSPGSAGGKTEISKILVLN